VPDDVKWGRVSQCQDVVKACARISPERWVTASVASMRRNREPAQPTGVSGALARFMSPLVARQHSRGIKTKCDKQGSQRGRIQPPPVV